MRRSWWWACNCTLKSICLLDTLNHALLRRRRVQWLCDRHDQLITGYLADEEMK